MTPNCNYYSRVMPQIKSSRGNRISNKMCPKTIDQRRHRLVDTLTCAGFSTWKILGTVKSLEREISTWEHQVKKVRLYCKQKCLYDLGSSNVLQKQLHILLFQRSIYITIINQKL